MSTKKAEFRPHNLIPGQVQERKFEILLGLTSIRSEKTIKCLRRHFVNGFSQADIVALFDVDNSNLLRDIKLIRAVAADLEEIKKLDDTGRKILHPTLGWVDPEKVIEQTGKN